MVLRARQLDADVMKMRVTLNWKTSLKRMKQESTALMVYPPPPHPSLRLVNTLISSRGCVIYSRRGRVMCGERHLFLPSVQRASEAQHPWGQAVVISADLVPQSRCARNAESDCDDET